MRPEEYVDIPLVQCLQRTVAQLTVQPIPPHWPYFAMVPPVEAGAEEVDVVEVVVVLALVVVLVVLALVVDITGAVVAVDPSQANGRGPGMV